MAQRRIPVTNPQKLVTYYKDRDGWHVQMRHGARRFRDVVVESKEAAIEQTKSLIAQFPGAIFELCTLGECWAWETPEGWVYSRTAGSPTAERVRVLDEFGKIVLQRGASGFCEFIEGAEPKTVTGDATDPVSSERGNDCPPADTN
jgi:hypothetical protein